MTEGQRTITHERDLVTTRYTISEFIFPTLCLALPSATVTPLPVRVLYATTCVRILQYLTSALGGVFTAVAAFLSFVAALLRVRCRRRPLISQLAAAHRRNISILSTTIGAQ